MAAIGGATATTAAAATAFGVLGGAAAIAGGVQAYDANRKANNAANNAIGNLDRTASGNIGAGGAQVGQAGRGGKVITNDYGNGLVKYEDGSLDNLNIETTQSGTYTTGAATGGIPNTAVGANGLVDVNLLQQQAQAAAAQNAANSAALEAQYNPGAQELRAGSLQALLAGLSPNGQTTAIQNLISQQAGQPLTVNPAPQYDSALTRAAVAKAQQDLALGGQLPFDVRNLIARKALAQSGAVSGGLGLGRDITARDLGLTSLQIEQQRLNNAATLGNAEAALGAGNASLRQNYNAQSLAAQQYARDNLLNSGNFLSNIQGGDFARALAAAQLGQGITPPASGLDPGSIANIAVGNVNNMNNAAQQAAALRVQQANGQTNLAAQGIGTGLGVIANAIGNSRTGSGSSLAPVSSLPTFTSSMPSFDYGLQTYAPTAYTPGSYNYGLSTPAPAPIPGYAGSMAPVFCWVARSVYGADNPRWTEFRQRMLETFDPEFVDFYGKHGEAIAAEIEDNPRMKTFIRGLMDHTRRTA